MTEWQQMTTQERIALVKAKWTPEGSALAIARAIGMGVTRNVVMGVYYRFPALKFSHPLGGNKGKVIGGARKAKTAEPARKYVSIVHRQELVTQQPRPVYIAPAIAPESRRLALLEITDKECKWPSDERPFTFCGQPAEGSYCRYHARLAWAPPRERVAR